MANGKRNISEHEAVTIIKPIDLIVANTMHQGVDSLKQVDASMAFAP